MLNFWGTSWKCTLISHLVKRKIIDSKVPAGGGCVSSQEGNTVIQIPKLRKIWTNASPASKMAVIGESMNVFVTVDFGDFTFFKKCGSSDFSPLQVQVAFRHLLVHLVLSRIVERMFQHVHGNLRGPPQGHPTQEIRPQ